MQATINIPVILEFDDYHEIEYVASHVRKLIKGLKSKELSFRDGSYWAIFYLKRDEEYKRLVEKHEKLARKYQQYHEDE